MQHALTTLLRRDKGTTSELMATTAASGRPEQSKVKTAKTVELEGTAADQSETLQPGVLIDFPGTDNMKR